MDGGAEKPVGFGVTVGTNSSGLLDQLREVGKLLERIDAGTIQAGGGGADIAPLMRDGVPGLGLRTVGTHYFAWHHTPSAPVHKVKLENLRLNLPAMARL